MGSRGKNNKSYALWEELNLRVSNEVGKVAIYKKTFNDTRDGKIPDRLNHDTTDKKYTNF